MPDIDVNKWDSIWQYFAALGGLAAGAFMWVLGHRAKGAPSDESPDRLHARLDMEELRRDLEAVLAAQRVALENKLELVREDVRKLERELWEAKSSMRGHPGPAGPQGPQGEPGPQGPRGP